MSAIEELFGASATVFEKIGNDLLADTHGQRYLFMSSDKYEELLRSSPQKAMQVYWEELLARAHMAAASNVVRHLRWLNACVDLYNSGNYLAFNAALRGLIEATGDALDALCPVPDFLARQRKVISESLAGRATGMYLAQELEDKLIHFQYGRKVPKSENAPATHKAKKASEYLAAFGSGADQVRELYGDLCQTVHPAAQSLMWAVEEHEDSLVLLPRDEKGLIRDSAGQTQTPSRP